MNGVAVIGIAALPVGRHTGTLEHEMAVQVLLDAVADAGIGKSRIDALVFSPRGRIRSSATSVPSSPDT